MDFSTVVFVNVTGPEAQLKEFHLLYQDGLIPDRLKPQVDETYLDTLDFDFLSRKTFSGSSTYDDEWEDRLEEPSEWFPDLVFQVSVDELWGHHQDYQLQNGTWTLLGDESDIPNFTAEITEVTGPEAAQTEFWSRCAQEFGPDFPEAPQLTLPYTDLAYEASGSWNTEDHTEQMFQESEAGQFLQDLSKTLKVTITLVLDGKKTLHIKS